MNWNRLATITAALCFSAYGSAPSAEEKVSEACFQSSALHCGYEMDFCMKTRSTAQIDQFCRPQLAQCRENARRACGGGGGPSIGIPAPRRDPEQFHHEPQGLPVDGPPGTALYTSLYCSNGSPPAGATIGKPAQIAAGGTGVAWVKVKGEASNLWCRLYDDPVTHACGSQGELSDCPYAATVLLFEVHRGGYTSYAWRVYNQANRQRQFTLVAK